MKRTRPQSTATAGAPLTHALAHALDVEHALSEALAHELCRQQFVVLVEVGHLAGVDEVDGVEVLLGLRLEHAPERVLVCAHAELDEVRPRRVEAAQPNLARALDLEQPLERQERIASQPGEEYPGVTAQIDEGALCRAALFSRPSRLAQARSRIVEQVRVYLVLR